MCEPVAGHVARRVRPVKTSLSPRGRANRRTLEDQAESRASSAKALDRSSIAWPSVAPDQIRATSSDGVLVVRVPEPPGKKGSETPIS
jgi:hypothetical protein